MKYSKYKKYIYKLIFIPISKGDAFYWELRRLKFATQQISDNWSHFQFYSLMIFYFVFWILNTVYQTLARCKWQVDIFHASQTSLLICHDNLTSIIRNEFSHVQSVNFYDHFFFFLILIWKCTLWLLISPLRRRLRKNSEFWK